MKKLDMSLKFNLFFFILCFNLIAYSQSQATYTITFTGTWNAADHSDNGNIPLPSNDHWSNLVGATHNANISFWNPGEFASLGIENVAETGDNAAFFNEVDTQITANNADQWLQQAFSPNHATGSATLMSVTVTENFPLLTLVSMIAPSPDWFVGIHDISLLDNDDNWIDSMDIALFPYDAGTEEGNEYSINNNATNPQENISSQVNIAPFNNQKVGTLRIVKQPALNVNRFEWSSNVKVFPNPTNGPVSVTTNSHNLSKIKVFNLLGKQVLTQNAAATQGTSNMNLKHLKNGVYIIKLINNKGLETTRKLIKK